MDTRTTLDVSSIGRRVAQGRAALRLEQTALAERAGLSRAYISRLEGGIVPNPKLFDLQRVAEALGVSLTALVTPERAPRDLYIAEGADILDAVAAEPPELQASLISTFRQAVEIVRATRLALSN